MKPVKYCERRWKPHPSTRILEAKAGPDPRAEPNWRGQHHPDIIMLDLEIDDQFARDALADDFQRRVASPSNTAAPFGQVARRVRQKYPAGQFVNKPYHYAPLIRKIEALLEGAAETTAGSGSA